MSHSRYLVASLLGLSVVVAFACSGDDDQQLSPGPVFNAGTAGTSGASGSSSGSAGSSGKSGSAGSSGSNAGNAGESGSAGSVGGGGSGGTTGGSAGNAGSDLDGGSKDGSAGANHDDAAVINPDPDASAGSGGSGGSGPVTLCDKANTFPQKAELAGLNTSDDEYFGSITPDGLTIAWQVVSGGTTTVFTAERNAESDAFGAPTQVTTPSVGFSKDKSRVALSPDGLRIAFVSLDGKTLTQITRASRTVAFDSEPSATAFAAINTWAFDGNDHLGFPVFSPDDLTMYFAFGDPSLQPVIRMSTRPDTGSPWVTNTPVEGSAVTATGEAGVVPTGISADAMTLFVFAPAQQFSYAAFKDNSGAFEVSKPLGAIVYAAPNAGCTGLYFSQPTSANGLDLFTGQ